MMFMAKEKKLLSLDPATKARLEQFAEEKHTTVSQAVTDWIWQQPVAENQEKREEND